MFQNEKETFRSKLEKWSLHDRCSDIADGDDDWCFTATFVHTVG